MTIRRATLLLVIAGGVHALPAAASEQSQALASRGLIELNNGHTRAALDLFDQAVAADPSDVTARYQRGVTRVKLGDDAGGIADLQAVLAARPDFPGAALDLGIALVDTDRNAEAEPWLLQAQLQPDLDGQASFYLGIAQLRLERYAAAQQSFERARLRDPSLDVPTQYYQGVLAYRQHHLSSAESSFAVVAQASPASTMGREATQFIELIRRDRRAAYSAWGTVAMEYDSNVTLGPSTSTVANGISGEGDFRAVIDVGGTYVPWTAGGASLTVSYEFFQSLQFHLTNFDLQDHRPALQLTYDFGPVFAGVVGRYDYYLLSTTSFMQEGTAYPWVAIRESGIGRTEIYDRLQRRDYKTTTVPDEAPSPGCQGPAASPTCRGFRLLDGFYNYAGVRQIFELGVADRELSAGMQLGSMHPVDQGDVQGGNPYQYNSYKFEVALRWPLPYAITSDTGFEYEHQNYDPASAIFPSGGGQQPNNGRRRDDDYRAIVSFERPIPEIYDHLFLNASWFGTFNNSNKSIFEYDRQIGSIGAEVRF